jgi:hypothetical protein
MRPSVLFPILPAAASGRIRNFKGDVRLRADRDARPGSRQPEIEGLLRT